MGKIIKGRCVKAGVGLAIEEATFNEVRKEINKGIKDCIEGTVSGGPTQGEVLVRIKVAVIEESKTLKIETEDGEMGNYIYKYRKPVISHKVTTTLKKQKKTKGTFDDGLQVIRVPGGYSLAPIEDEINLAYQTGGIEI